jgi:hypothetical protein
MMVGDSGVGRVFYGKVRRISGSERVGRVGSFGVTVPLAFVSGGLLRVGRVYRFVAKPIKDNKVVDEKGDD